MLRRLIRRWRPPSSVEAGGSIDPPTQRVAGGGDPPIHVFYDHRLVKVLRRGDRDYENLLELVRGGGTVYTGFHIVTQLLTREVAKTMFEHPPDRIIHICLVDYKTRRDGIDVYIEPSTQPVGRVLAKVRGVDGLGLGWDVVVWGLSGGDPRLVGLATDPPHRIWGEEYEEDSGD